MFPRLRSSILILACMLVAPTVAGVLRPTAKVADAAPQIDLDAMVPKQFGEWRINENTTLVAPSPELQAALNKIYNQTLSRTYVDNKGHSLMLSIAYGGDQSDSLQAHMPEGCYGGQGFAIQQQSKDELGVIPGRLPVTRLVAQKGQRIEPITYWVVVGTEPARDTWEMKLIKLRYAAKGEIPEGLLFRISNISANANEGFAIHESFAGELFAHISTEDRLRLFGRP